MSISREFRKDLPLSALVHAPTLELLANEIRPAARQERFPTLVRLGPAGSKHPFFVVHGGAGGILFMQRLAARMHDRPFYGIQPDGLDGRRCRYRTTEQAAEFYLSEIRKVQPKGPYLLGGYCFGGQVAFEMAQQLQREGEKVAAVVMLSAPLPRIPAVRASSGDAGEPFRTSLAPRLRRLIASPWRILSRRCRLFLSYRAQYALIFALGMKIPQKMRTVYVIRMLALAEERYRPKPYSGALQLFYGSNLTQFGPDLGWGGLAAELEHHVIGDADYKGRRQFFREPLVEEAARELDACLDAAMNRFASDDPVRHSGYRCLSDRAVSEGYIRAEKH